MNRVMFSLNFAPLIASLIFGCSYLMHSQWINALGSVVCGLAVTGALIWAGATGLLSEGYQFAGSIAMVLGLAGVMAYGNFFNSDLQRGYFAALMNFSEMENYCPRISPSLSSIRDYGIRACAFQGNRDAMSATTELQKGIHFGPAMTLVDSAATLAGDEQTNHCARAFKVALRLCPIAFSTIDKKERAALLTAAE